MPLRKSRIFLIVLIVVFIVVIFSVSQINWSKIGEVFKQRPKEDLTLKELRTIAEGNSVIEDFLTKNSGTQPTYSKMPDQDNVYWINYIPEGSNTGTSVMIDLNSKKILKIQAVTGVR